MNLGLHSDTTMVRFPGVLTLTFSKMAERNVRERISETEIGVFRKHCCA